MIIEVYEWIEGEGHQCRVYEINDKCTRVLIAKDMRSTGGEVWGFPEDESAQYEARLVSKEIVVIEG